jgi:[ribosomal protein S5]-alanine N-acetyltransferase
MKIEIRAFQTLEEYGLMIDYFVQSTPEFLLGMGVDPVKLPAREDWLQEVWDDHHKPGPEKDRIYLAWLLDGQLVGHSSINKIKWGEEASIHLHLWKPLLRRKGIGATFFRSSANYFFKMPGLRKLYCEPYAENPAPNRVLSKIGFRFVGTYRTVPGKTCFEQNVNRWELDHEIEELSST